MIWANLVMAILQVAPAIIQVVEKVQAGEPGEIKESTVVSIAVGTAAGAGCSEEQTQAIAAATSAVTKAIVSAYNAAGVFTHKDK